MNPKNYKKPDFSLKEARAMASKIYGLEPAEIKPLPGDRSENFLIQTASARKYVLKISSSFDHPEELDFENKVILKLSQELPDYRFPLPQFDLSGELLSCYETRDETFYLRLFDYVEGPSLADLQSVPLSLWSEIGRLLARIDLVLKDFYHAGSRRELPWDVKNVPWSKDRLKYVTDPVKRRQLDYALLQIETYLLPVSTGLRRQVIYGDGNEHNFILQVKKDTYRLTGLIDFGDMSDSFLAAEPAIALTYAMMKTSAPEEAVKVLLSAYHKINPLQPAELDVLYYLILSRLVISLTMAAWRHQSEPENKYMTVSEEPGWKLLNSLLTSNPEKWRRLFYKSCKLEPAPLWLESEKLLKFRNEHISEAMSLTYRQPLHITRGAGQYLFDDRGGAYLDCVNNVCHLGHCHPRVARAVARQMARLNTNTRYLYDVLALYVEKLLSKFPAKFQYCFLVNSGSEANDLALRLARNYTGGSEMLVLDGAYHGNLTSLIEISPYKFDGPGGKGAPAFVHKLTTPDPYRGPFRGHSQATGLKYAAEAKKVIENVKAENKKLVGLIAEPIMGCAGQVIFPPGYLKLVFDEVHKAGGVCIADEVQVGFGRPGRFFWGFESQEASPDIVTLGKPIGNGHPIGAVVTTEEIARLFVTGMEYFNTFGGNPVSCAAGLAVLEAIEEENLQENAGLVGDYFLKELKKLQKSHRLIGDVRGLGLFIGVELVKDRKTRLPATKEAELIAEKMKKNKILVTTEGPYHQVLKIKPAIIFNQDNVDLFVETLDKILKDLD